MKTFQIYMCCLSLPTLVRILAIPSRSLYQKIACAPKRQSRLDICTLEVTMVPTFETVWPLERIGWPTVGPSRFLRDGTHIVSTPAIRICEGQCLLLSSADHLTEHWHGPRALILEKPRWVAPCLILLLSFDLLGYEGKACSTMD